MQNIKLKYWAIAFAALITSSVSSPAQTTSAPAVPVAEAVRRAAAQRAVYLEEFKNLISKENKTFEIFDKKGQIKKRRTVTSVFIVYQPVKSKEVVEFRNVIAVDGKAVADADKRAEDLFTQLVDPESSEKELQKLQNESLRFDEGIYIDGLTLFQAVALADNLQPSFDFSLAGTDVIDGRDVVVLAYEQKRSSPFITTDTSAKPVEGKLTLEYDVDISGEVNPRLKGKLWLDAETMQVRRETRQLTVRPEGFASPIVFTEDEFQYVQTDFPLLAPKRIVHLQNRIGKKDAVAQTTEKVVFEYEKFTRPDVEVKSAEVK
ncbi:MAG: hypothetical protein ABI791_04190 [Acidobacteriota bacterium]